MIRILVVDTDPQNAERLETLVVQASEQPVEHASSVVEAIRAAQTGQVQVVLIGLGIPSEDALSATAEISERSPGTSVILVRPNVTTDLLRNAMRMGAADVVGADDATDDLRVAVQHAVQQAARMQETARTEETTTPRGSIVTVFSTKGGVGKTVLSTNLSVALAAMGKKVVLVDLDLQFGDVGIMLGLEPTLTISGPAQASDRLDAELLKGYLVAHSSGVKCLLAPVHPEEAETITPGRIARILEQLSEMFEFVVVDTCASLDETVLTALDRSDQLLAITMMDVASIKNTRISLQKLSQLGYDGRGVQVVLNRADSKVFLQPAQVEKAIGREIGIRIPSDRIVPQSVNKGVPVVTESPKSDVAKALSDVARQVADTHAKAVSAHVA